MRLSAVLFSTNEYNVECVPWQQGQGLVLYSVVSTRLSAVLHLTISTRSITLLDSNKTLNATINYLGGMNHEVKHFSQRQALYRSSAVFCLAKEGSSVFLDNEYKVEVNYFT